MESRNKLAMCRLCLCENESFINVFELNDGQGYIAAEVIDDLLQFQVSETDGYPHVVCSNCLVKLTDFKLFKECCQKSKDKYDNMFVSSESLEEYQSEMREFATVKAEPIFYLDNEDNISKDVGNDLELCDQDPLREASSPVTIKSEEVIIDSSSFVVSEDPLKETEVSYGPVLLKYEVLPFGRNRHTQDEVIDSEGSVNQDPVEYTASLMQDSTQVELPLVETVTHPKCTNYLKNKRPHLTYKGEIEADSSTWSISNNDEAIFEKTKNISLSEEVEASSSGTMERLEYQRILPGESMDMAPHFQQEKESVKMEQDIGEDGEAWQGTGREKGARGRREGLECFHCGIVFMSKLVLIRHMKVHGFVNSHDCAECGQVFRFNCQLKMHLLTHNGSKPHKCTEGSKSFSQSSNLKTHMILHTGSKLYRCVECSKSYSHSCSLKTHMRLHTGTIPYKCAKCSKRFNHSYSLKRHMRVHTGSKPYNCAECNKSFSNSTNLKNHLRIHTGSKPYKCAECSKSFSQSSNLKTHMRLHTGCKPYKCEQCNKSFSNSTNLKNHTKIHTDSNMYKCSECSKSYNQISNLKTHLRVHAGSKQYKCAECNKSFSNSTNLKNHMRIHSGSKPFKCSDCSKSFNQSSNLKTHMRLHTGCKPYKCSECSKSYSQSSNLKKHMRLHIG